MKYGLIGEKLGHSFSAEIHSRLFDYPYELKELSPTGLADFIKKREFSAINVTLPYKEVVIPLLDEVDETALSIGAVNTVVNRDGRLIGYNTDYAGLKALIDHFNIILTDKKVLILGSGGTSKTALAVARSMRCREVLQVSRTERESCITYDQARKQHADADVIINTTPCGMYPNIGESAVDLTDFPSLSGVIDVVYNPLRTKLLCDALKRGIPAVGGLYMLVAQAVRAAELFTDQKVSVDRMDSVYGVLMAEKQNVVLIGMPGCGKTTVGKRLAEELQFEFVDTDRVIEQREGRTISNIFATDGEGYFRSLESEIVKEYACCQHMVIATGGGVILNPENIAFLRQNGRVYFLDRPLDQLCATVDRPLSADRDALEQRYRERYAIYRDECDAIVSAEGSVEDVVHLIREDLCYE